MAWCINDDGVATGATPRDPSHFDEVEKVEAPGIEPGSRCTSALASTCVACRICRAEPCVFIERSSTSKANARLTGQVI